MYSQIKLVAKPASRDRKACRNAPCMCGHPHMFGCPAYVWMPCICLDAPTCLDTPHVWMPLVCFDDVWMPPVHTLHKESMLCQTKGVSICPNTFGCHHMFGCSPVCLDGPHMFGCPLYVWISLICLDASCMFG